MTADRTEIQSEQLGNISQKPIVSQAQELPTPSMETAFCCVAQFSSALTNQSLIVPALKEFAATFQLEKVSLLRTLSGSFSARRIAWNEPNAPFKTNLEMLESIANDPEISAGSFLSAERCEEDHTVMIVLRADAGSLDVLHMVMSSTASPHGIDMLASLAPALSAAWNVRPPGYAKALLAAQRRNTRRRDERDDAPILCVDNSYGLSRSEFRVCRLLETGLRPREIADELGLSVATVRSHLGNIYSKTELSGQLAVVSHLNSNRASEVRAA